MFFFFFFHWPGLARGQDSLIYQKITIRDTSLKVQQVFGLISKSTGLSFSYNPEIIDLERNVRVTADQESLHSILDRVLEDPSLEYRIIGHQIVIFRPVVIRRSDAETSYAGKTGYRCLRSKAVFWIFRTSNPFLLPAFLLLDKSEGTVANLQGDFLLKIDSRHIQDSLAVSCMGYETLILPVSDFITRPQNYYLKPDIIPIQEVIIRKKNSTRPSSECP